MKKSIFFGLSALLTLGAVSCSKDDLVPGSSQPLDTDQSFFVNVNVGTTDAMTRAIADDPFDYDNYDPSTDPAFNKGTDQENKVRTIFFIFYDEDENRVATTQIRRDNNGNFSNASFSEVTVGRSDSENSLFKGVVQIDIKHGSKKPASVMCFINPITSQNFDINPSFATLTELQKTTRPRIIDDNDYFAMSKSVYFGDPNNEYSMQADENGSAVFEKVITTPIDENSQLFNTFEEAKKELDNDTQNNSKKIVDIYVERYAAKVQFTIENNASKEIDVDRHKLQFIPEYWAVNAYEEETYICKSFMDPSGSRDLKYDELNMALIDTNNEPWKWNNPQFHRSYWAQSPAYYAANYPRVADDILDGPMSTAHAGGFALGYYSYNDMVYHSSEKAPYKEIARKARNFQDPEDKNRPIYARENTVQGAALYEAYKNAFASPKAAIPSIVVVGHYTVDGNPIDEDDTFYVMGNKVNGYTFFEQDDDNPSDADMLTYFMNTTIPFYINDRGLPFFQYGIDGFKFLNNDYRKYFKISHPDQGARHYQLSDEEGLVIDSRFVTVQLDTKALEDDDVILYAYINGEYIKTTPENYDYINQQMLYAAGTAQGFQGGKAYYTIPIKHLGYYRTDNYNKDKSPNDKTFDWSRVKSGDYGLVRNHIYSIVVDEISGLGNGIPNPDDPIVPPTDPEEYFIGARVIILNWAVVPTQHETL